MKNWFNSRTVWLAVIQFVIGGLVVIQAQYPELGFIVMVKSVLDMLLRILTDKPLVS